MPRIFDSLNRFLANQILNGDMKHLTDDEKSYMECNSLAQLIDIGIVEFDDTKKYAEIENSLYLSQKAKALKNLACCVLYIAKRKYLEAGLHLQSAAQYSGTKNWWSFSSLLSRAVLRLYLGVNTELALVSNLASSMNEKDKEYQIDFLTSFALIIATTKLTYVTTPQSWTDNILESIRYAWEMQKKLDDSHSLREARLLQAQGSIDLAEKNIDFAITNFHKALSISTNILGNSDGYNTELMIDIANCHLQQKQKEEGVRFCQEAITCETTGSADNLRLAKAFHCLSDMQSGEIAYESLKQALTYYETASKYHFIDRLIVLHRMARIARRCNQLADLEEINTKIADVQKQERPYID